MRRFNSLIVVGLLLGALSAAQPGLTSQPLHRFRQKSTVFLRSRK
ncbi:hypothetical protein [Bosea sp. (in: a-proteobacteria)]